MSDATKKEQQVTEIYADVIDDPHDPMRSALDREALYQLADDIKQNGLINPITVRPQKSVPKNSGDTVSQGNGGSVQQTTGDLVGARGEAHQGDAAPDLEVPTRYEVVAGHRRFSALKIAGIIKIPCIVRDLTDEQVFAVRASENLERVDVDPVDEGRFLKQYMEGTGKSVEEIAKQIRRSVTYVASRIAVGGMDDYMQEGLKSGALKLGTALAFTQITDDGIRRVWVEMAIRDGISVAQAEHWVSGWKLNQLSDGVNDLNPPTDYAPSAPKQIRFKCALSGIEDDARMYDMVPIHRSQRETLRVVAAEMQKPEPAAELAPVPPEIPQAIPANAA